MITKDEYLRLLAKQYPTAAKAVTEIINLEAIMNLPKATELFISDLHGENDAVEHVLKTGSGNIKKKIKRIFKDRLSTREMNQLATIVYYPEEKIKMIVSQLKAKEEIDEFYSLTLSRITELCAYVVSKYTRSKVRRALPRDYAYIIEELLFKDAVTVNKEDYYSKIINTVISLGRAGGLITAIASVIRRLVVDHFHVVGDIFDRGPAPDKIIENLMDGHEVDIQWGNHDILWIGAASGSAVCICNVIRICAGYNNLGIIEDAYGISLRPLLTFAEMNYPDENYKPFSPTILEKGEKKTFPEEIRQTAKMNQAISVIQFKLEGKIIKRHPEFEMDNRRLLSFIDYEKETICIDGKEHRMHDSYFPTVDPQNPYAFTEEEKYLIDRLISEFQNSDKLQRHIQFLLSKGSMYLNYNDNLLFHGCIPLNDDGSFMKMPINGTLYSGKALLDKYEDVLRKGYANRANRKRNSRYLDYVWYLWEGKASPLFGKAKLTTFERLYISDPDTHIEKKNLYYELRNDKDFCQRILEDFGLDPHRGHIINGHTPVKEKDGENPVKADGKLIVIDGSFSKAYRDETGLSGYTLLYNSYGMQLVSHQPFTSRQEVIENEADIASTRRIVDTESERQTVRETDVGKKLTKQVEDLKQLLHAYNTGDIVDS